jgi:hypothetical protein
MEFSVYVYIYRIGVKPVWVPSRFKTFYSPFSKFFHTNQVDFRTKPTKTPIKSKKYDILFCIYFLKIVRLS